MSLDPSFLSGKRRYKVLLRENKNPLGSLDPLVLTELEALEEKFPELRQLKGAAIKQDVVPSLSTGRDKVPLQQDYVEYLDINERGNTANFRNSAPRIGNNSESPTLSKKNEESSSKLNEKNHLERCFALATFALNLYSGFYNRSAFGPLNYAKALIFSIAIALFHVFVLDPCSPLGMHIMPSLFCIMINLSNLYSLYVRQRGRVSIPMLLVYTCLDFVPSLISIFVFYLLTIASLNKVLGSNLDFVCITSLQEIK
ncbi:unnamed protein product [Phytomonas sp. Hart1]|nr:unnamed protein product [Phytomonas sp. Hart1]|eukprot:CCW71301.1 unnamed protein product [Phytomonas sp. isolate Hart1]